MNGGDDCDSTIKGSLETESCNTKIVCPGLVWDSCKLPDQTYSSILSEFLIK